MNKRPGRKTQNKTSSYNRIQLSADAKIIFALLKNQPQNKADLIKTQKLSEPTFYRVINLLKNKDIIKLEDGKYALWNYDCTEKQIKEILMQPVTDRNWRVSFLTIANQVGKPYSQIEPLVYRIVKELGLNIVPQDGQLYIFLKS